MCRKQPGLELPPRQRAILVDALSRQVSSAGAASQDRPLPPAVTVPRECVPYGLAGLPPPCSVTSTRVARGARARAGVRGEAGSHGDDRSTDSCSVEPTPSVLGRKLSPATCPGARRRRRQTGCGVAGKLTESPRHPAWRLPTHAPRPGRAVSAGRRPGCRAQGP